MAKPKLNYKERTPDEKVTLGKTIKTALTGNAHFTTPNPSLASLGTLITTAETKVNAAKAADLAAKQATLDRDLALDALGKALAQLATYVENTSGGDPVIIESAGMEVRSSTTPIGPLGQVGNMTVTVGDDDGELDVAWDPVRGAKTYEVQTSPDPITPTSWRTAAASTTSRKTLKDLTSGARLWVRVRAVARKDDNTGAWSDPAVKTVP